MKIRTRELNTMPLELIPAISGKVTGISEFQIQILFSHNEKPAMPNFDASTPASSVYEWDNIFIWHYKI
ncbi:hypothetical protein TNCV_1961461 [Trichonephila clavipes]|nr:hypothetical protein TNCV_1961461 [Trichonephila clavipes]